MLVWLKTKKRPSGEDPAEWDLHDLTASWRIWNLLEAMDWKFLPFQGGLLEQPDWLLEDLATIAWRRRRVEDMMKGSLPGVSVQRRQ